jgi:hypothetical protein
LFTVTRLKNKHENAARNHFRRTSVTLLALPRPEVMKLLAQVGKGGERAR